MREPTPEFRRLASQLLEAANSGAPLRGLVRAALADAWRGVHFGDPTAPGRWRDELSRLGPGAFERGEIRELDEALEVASATLRDRRASPAAIRIVSELRPILSALRVHRAEPLTRTDILQLVKDEGRWSSANALSYPLDRLAEAELVLVTHRPRQGGVARHYALSALGVRACVEAGVGERDTDRVGRTDRRRERQVASLAAQMLHLVERAA